MGVVNECWLVLGDFDLVMGGEVVEAGGLGGGVGFRGQGGARGNALAGGFKEGFEAGRGDEAEEAGGLGGVVLKAMGGVGGDVDGVAGAGDVVFVSEGEGECALEDVEEFVEVVAVGRRAASGGNVHLDEGVSAAGLGACDDGGVDVADEGEVVEIWVGFGVGDGDVTGRVVGGDHGCLRSSR